MHNIDFCNENLSKQTNKNQDSYNQDWLLAPDELVDKIVCIGLFQFRRFNVILFRKFMKLFGFLIFQAATKIQKTWKGQRQRRKFDEIRVATIKIQESFMTWKLRILFLKKRRAAVVIQVSKVMKGIIEKNLN